MSDEILVKVEGARKKFCRSLKQSLWYGMKDVAGEVLGAKGRHEQLRNGEFWAVNDVSFELRRGDCLGLIGRNGAGKTTLLKMLNGLIKPDTGKITMRGRVGALIALGAGFNPILTGRENIYVNGSVLGLAKREIEEKIEDIIDFADIREFIDSPVQSYSSGMQVRLGFAVASSLSPDILLIDEVLAVGDLAFRDKCITRILRIRDAGAALIFVSHNLPQTMAVCNVGAYLSAGRLITFGSISDTCMRYLDDVEHPPSRSEEPETGKVAAHKIRSISCAGADKGEVQSLQPAVFQMEVSVSTALTDCFPAFHIIENSTSKLIASVDSSHLKGVSLSQGAHTFTCQLADLPLIPGTYSVRAFLIHKYEVILARYGVTENPYQLRVAARPGDPNAFGRASGALVAIRADWRLES